MIYTNIIKKIFYYLNDELFSRRTSKRIVIYLKKNYKLNLFKYCKNIDDSNFKIIYIYIYSLLEIKLYIIIFLYKIIYFFYKI